MLYIYIFWNKERAVENKDDDLSLQKGKDVPETRKEREDKDEDGQAKDSPSVDGQGAGQAGAQASQPQGGRDSDSQHDSDSGRDSDSQHDSDSGRDSDSRRYADKERNPERASSHGTGQANDDSRNRSRGNGYFNGFQSSGTGSGLFGSGKKKNSVALVFFIALIAVFLFSLFYSGRGATEV